MYCECSIQCTVLIAFDVTRIFYAQPMLMKNDSKYEFHCAINSIRNGYTIHTSMPCHKTSRNCASVLISIFLDQHNIIHITYYMVYALHSFFLTFNVCVYLFVSSAFPIIFFSLFLYVLSVS